MQGDLYRRLVCQCTSRRLEGKGDHLDGVLRLPRLGPELGVRRGVDEGDAVGFVTDVDDQGNRFNPNKLLIDPYAAELSHDPRNTTHNDGSVYITGLPNRTKDSGKFAPKGVVLTPDASDVAVVRPGRSVTRSCTRSTSAG